MFNLPISHLLDILASLLVGHLFGGTKKTIWLAMMRASFGVCGAKRKTVFTLLPPLIVLWNLFCPFTWCKAKHHFLIIAYPF